MFRASLRQLKLVICIWGSDDNISFNCFGGRPGLNVLMKTSLSCSKILQSHPGTVFDVA